MDLPALAKGSNLSRTQLLLWASYRRYDGLPVDTVPFAFEIRGPLDREAFRAASDDLVARHEALRSVFDDADGVPRRRLRTSLDDTLEIVDLSGTDDPDAELASWLERRHREVLPLGRRAFRSALLRLGPERHVWHLYIHHLVTDGWSMGLIYSDLESLYRARVAGARSPRDRERAPHAPSLEDFYRERGESVGGERFRRDEAYWAERLADLPATVGLYGEDTDERSPRERRVSRRLDAETTRRLRKLAERPDLRLLRPVQTLSALCTTALLATLHKVSGASRLTVAVPLHARTTRSSRQLVGLVQETFPLDLEVDADETSAALARRVLDETWRAQRHSACGTPLGRRGFDVIANYLPVRFADFAGLPTTARWLHNGYGNGSRSLFLHLYDFHGDGRLTLDLDCNEAACDAGRQERFADHLLNAFRRLAADPDRPLASLDVMTAAERRRVVAGFNRTRVEEIDALTVSGWLERDVDRWAELDAVVHGERRLTYAELARAASRFAARLRALGVRGGAPVAVRADRSVELMVALLGILRAGGAYLPLDPSFPADRLRFMLEDSGAAVLVVAARYARAPLATAARDLVVLELEETVAGCLGEAEEDRGGGERPVSRQAARGTARPHPDDAAYVIYTSGSTGRPKGVVMSQRALANLTWWQVRHGTRLERPRTLQFTPLSFDVSLQETFSTWCAGGTLVLLDEATRRDPVATLRLIEEHGVERLFAIYTPLRRMAEAACREDVVPASLREVTAVGEQLQITPALRELFTRLPDAVLYNQYGPSETHNITAHLLPESSSAGGEAAWPLLPTIGRPITNSRVYIVDRRLRPVPIGVSGEICLGGAQVALGYINRPALTAERFVPDPFGETPGARLYRTGDIGRFTESGDIEFLGRLDHQVKVRGYRIEPGEIEAALRRHPEVREAVVVARADAGRDRQLVGYVVPPGPVGEATLAARLREHLLDALPEYMVPSAFVVLDGLPQTANGKLDRAALPAPSGLRPELAGGFAEPSGGTERRIAGIWSEVLGLERVGRHDNFFELGGNSLLLLEVHARLPRGAAGPALPVAELFRLPTVSDLAARLEGGASWSAAEAAARAERQKRASERRRRARVAPPEVDGSGQ